jgi:hypothetical protein
VTTFRSILSLGIVLAVLGGMYHAFPPVADISPAPDYIVEYILIGPATPVEGNVVTFYSRVRNIGNAAGAAYANVHLSIDTNLDGTWDLDMADHTTAALYPGGTKAFTWRSNSPTVGWKTVVGIHKVRVCIFTPFLESNENNNCRQLIFEVLSRSGSTSSSSSLSSRSSSRSSSQRSVGRVDANGCLIDQGYVWCPLTRRCIQPRMELCP